MAWIALAPGVVFDVRDEEGCLIHILSGYAYALDPLTTALLQAALTAQNMVDAIVSLREVVEADDQQLAEGFHILLKQLEELKLIHTDQKDGSLFPHSSRKAREPIPPEHLHPALLPPRKCSLPKNALFQHFFLTGDLTQHPLPQISWWQRGWAIWRLLGLLLTLGYYRVRASLGRHQAQWVSHAGEQAWGSLGHTLSSINRYALGYEAEVLHHMARQELVYCQLVVRLLAPTALCLVRSVACCTYLRALGFPAQVVIGRSRFDLSEHRFAFHAWTEVAGIIVNDHAELQSGYTTIQRLPAYEEK